MTIPTYITVTSGTHIITVDEHQQVILQESNDIHTLECIVTVGAYAQVEYHLSAYNQDISTRKIIFELSGQHAQVQCSGALRLDGQQQYVLDVVQLHTGAHTKSSVVLRMVVAAQAECRYQGTITIQETAVKSVASQEHKALVISDQAKVTSEPKLEALTNDIMCSHGAAISYVQQEHLTYLMSRGLSESDAKQLIINGFLNQ